MAPSSSKIAAPAKYSLDSSSWKKVDHFFASFWCHEDVTSLLLFIQDYDVIATTGPETKPSNFSASISRLTKPTNSTPSFWICAIATAQEFLFPHVQPIKINGDLDVFSGTGMFNMPQDVLAREASPGGPSPIFLVFLLNNSQSSLSLCRSQHAKRLQRQRPPPKRLQAHYQATAVNSSGIPVVLTPSQARLPRARGFANHSSQAERSTRIAAATPLFGKVEVMIESPPTKSKPQTRSSTSRRQTQPPAKSSVPKSVTIIDGEPSDEESAPAGSEVGDGEEDADGDVEMTPAVTTRATKKKGKGKGKKAKPTAMRDTDASTIPEVIGELLSQRQGNRKVTEPAEFNVVPEGLRIIGTVRLPTTANPVYYNGMPAANTGKRYHLHEDRVDGDKLQLEELESITTKTLSDFREAINELDEAISAAAAAREVADEASLRVAKWLSRLSANAIALVDKLAPPPSFNVLRTTSPPSPSWTTSAHRRSIQSLLGEATPVESEPFKSRLPFPSSSSSTPSTRSAPSSTPSRFRRRTRERGRRGRGGGACGGR
ncbi:hypothetical protein B0H12DRAFT_1068237 [Mycena haematopus]|nr:hypothetical protein B0H12DRAFT_1068237 [Mycena haematopus]